MIKLGRVIKPKQAAHRARFRLIDRAVNEFEFTTAMTSLPYYMRSMGFTYTRNSTKRVLQNGALVELSANQFGTSYDPVTGLYAYVPEPAATNLIPYSEGAAANWTLSNTSQAAESFFGFDNAIEFGNNSIQRDASQSVAVSAVNYTLSVFVKMDDGLAPVYGSTTSTGDFSLLIGSGLASVTPLVVNMGGGVYRVSANRTPAAATQEIRIRKYAAQSSRTFKVAGFQIEAVRRATSYIKTTGASATRDADILTIPLANVSGFNSAAYSMLADCRSDISFATNGRVIILDDGTGAERSTLYRASTPIHQCLVTDNNVQQIAINEPAFSTSRTKFACSLTTNSALTSFSGASGSSSGTITMPTVSTLRIGTGVSAGAEYNGYIYRVALITKTLTQTQLNALTS